MKKQILNLVIVLITTLAFSQNPKFQSILFKEEYTIAQRDAMSLGANDHRIIYVVDTGVNELQIWDGDSWESLGGGDVTIPTLQQVTEASASTDQALSINADITLGNYNSLKISDGTYNSAIARPSSGFTSNRVFRIPDRDGTPSLAATDGTTTVNTGTDGILDLSGLDLGGGSGAEYTNTDNTNGRLRYYIIPDNFDFSSIPANYDNAIWIIRHVHDLGGANITLPSNVTLNFQGGRITNYGVITLDDTYINTDYQAFDTSGSFVGNLKNNKVYPFWFGAVGDGTVNDTNAFVSAVALSSKKVHLRKGYNYLLDAITINNPILIEGNNAAITVNTGVSNVFIRINSNDTTFKNINFDANNQDARILEYDNGVANLKVNGCKFYNLIEDDESLFTQAIYCETGTSKTNGIEIIDNYFGSTNVGDWGSAVILYNPENALIKGNTTYRRGGIQVLYNQSIEYDGIEFSDNTYIQSQGSVILARPSADAVVSSVKVLNNNFKDVNEINKKFTISIAEIIGTNNSIFKSVIIYGNRGNVLGGGIKVGENLATENAILACSIENNHFTNYFAGTTTSAAGDETGIIINGRGHRTCTNNTIIGFGREGIQITCENAVIHGNVVDNCVQSNVVADAEFLAGIQILEVGFFDVENIVVKGNICKNNGVSMASSAVAGISLGRSTDIKNVIIDGNVCYDDRDTKEQQYGIRLGEFGAGVAQPIDVLVKDNILKGNAVQGIINYNENLDKGFIIKDNIAQDQSSIITLEADLAEPSVALCGDLYTTANTVATTLTDFLNGFVGQEFTLLVGDDNTTIDFTSGTTHFTGYSADIALAQNDILKIKKISASEWHVSYTKAVIDLTDLDEMIFVGDWNAATNSPPLNDSTGVKGRVYRVSQTGSQNLGLGYEADVFQTGTITNLNNAVASFNATGLDSSSDGSGTISTRPRVQWAGLTIGAVYELDIIKVTLNSGTMPTFRLYNGDAYVVQDDTLSVTAVEMTVGSSQDPFFTLDGQGTYDVSIDIVLRRKVTNGLNNYTRGDYIVHDGNNYVMLARSSLYQEVNGLLNTYTYSTLPTGRKGLTAIITDADTPTYRGTASGGGSDVALVMYDGTNWIYH